jgi:hypothetical protein
MCAAFDRKLTLKKIKHNIPIRLYSIFVPRMKAVGLFLLCLFFILLKGSEPAHAAGHDTLRRYSAVLHTDRLQQTSPFGMRLALLPVRSHNISDKKETLSLDVDDDDEQEDFLYAGKSVMPVTFFITLAWLSISAASYSYIKNRIPFCGHFSYTSTYKYILQRVLRI